jgi:two-component system sensor histidine kinase HydH
VLNRTWQFKLLAPTVLVSLCLVGTCVAAALYLQQLQEEVSGPLTENIQSAVVAGHLEESLKELRRYLLGDHRHFNSLQRNLKDWNERVARQLRKVEDLANLPDEQKLVQTLRTGVDAYQEKWRQRDQAKNQAVFDTHLADILTNQVLPAVDHLHHYNTDQVGAAEQANRQFLSRLTWGLLAVGFGAPLSGLILGYAMARNLYQSIYQLRVRIRDAAGRLNKELPPVTLEDSPTLPDLHQQIQNVVEEVEDAVEELQQRERAMLRAEQLAAVGQVAAGVAHELRNPLTSVKMLAQTGLEGPNPTGLPPDDLAIIEHEVRRMEACIQTFLDFARPPSTERRRSDLLTVVRRALTLVEGRARRQKVNFKVELPPGPVELLIDPEQIHQVLVNLLLNALDALPHGGIVHITVEGPCDERPFATVRIQDTGAGIAPRIKERLFEPFVSGKETGLGLGLSISRRLVEAHGGIIQGENPEEGGALFTFTLPV